MRSDGKFVAGSATRLSVFLERKNMLNIIIADCVPEKSELWMGVPIQKTMLIVIGIT